MSQPQPTSQSVERIAPAGVNFANLLPLGVRGVAKARKFQPNNGQQFTSVNNIIRIPLNSTGFIDTQHSYLQWDIAINGAVATGICLEGSSQCVIRTLRIEGSDGSELERIDNYNVAQAALSDLQVGSNHKNTIENGMDLSFGAPAAAATFLTSQATDLTGTAPVVANQAPLLWTNADAGTTKGCCMKLMSGLLNNPKYLPCGFVAGGGVVLELTLDTDVIALYDIGQAGTAATYTISNVNYIAQVVEMADSFNEAFRSMLNEQSGIQWAGQTLRGHQFNFQGSAVASTQTVPIAERAKSIKAIYQIFRSQAQINSIDNHSLTRRTFNGCTQYQFRIGSNVYPSQPVRGSNLAPNEYIAELYKSVAGLGDVRQGGKINRLSFVGYDSAGPTFGDPTAQTANYGSNGFYGIDLEVYAQSSEVLESGVDTSSLSLPINVDYSFGAAAVGQVNAVMTVNSFCLVDVLYSLDASGLLTAAM